MIEVYFDMDGTIADLYGVEEWETKLNTQDETPYKEAKPCGNLLELMELLKQFNVRVGVISWCAMNSDKEYDKKVRQAKKQWLKDNFPIVEECHIVKYGTPKHYTIKKEKRTTAILVDDNMSVCEKWQGESVNFNTYEELMKKLKNTLQKIAA